MKPSLMPYFSSNSCLCSLRSAITADMSTSLNVVSRAGVVLGLDQPLGDAPADRAHRHDFFLAAVAAGRGAGRGGASGRCDLARRGIGRRDFGADRPGAWSSRCFGRRGRSASTRRPRCGRLRARAAGAVALRRGRHAARRGRVRRSEAFGGLDRLAAACAFAAAAASSELPSGRQLGRRAGFHDSRSLRPLRPCRRCVLSTLEIVPDDGRGDLDRGLVGFDLDQVLVLLDASGPRP